jgi:hypothetical protein
MEGSPADPTFKKTYYLEVWHFALNKITISSQNYNWNGTPQFFFHMNSNLIFIKSWEIGCIPIRVLVCTELKQLAQVHPVGSGRLGGKTDVLCLQALKVRKRGQPSKLHLPHECGSTKNH